MARPYGINLHYKDSPCTWQQNARKSSNHSALFCGSGWSRLFPKVSSAATGLRICLTHTLCLKNVLDCASCHKPYYVSAKCEVSRGFGSVPGGYVWLWVQVLKISCMNSSSEDINTHSAINYYMLMLGLCAEECWGALWREWQHMWIYCINVLIVTKVDSSSYDAFSKYWKHCKVLRNYILAF